MTVLIFKIIIYQLRPPKTSVKPLWHYFKMQICLCLWLWRTLVKAKVPAAAKANEERPKGLVLFEPKPPTPKLLKAFGHIGKGDLIGKLMVQSSHRHHGVVWCGCCLCWENWQQTYSDHLGSGRLITSRVSEQWRESNVSFFFCLLSAENSKGVEMSGICEATALHRLKSLCIFHFSLATEAVVKHDQNGKFLM